MCGIVGLFLKDKSLEPQLGSMLSQMLISLSDRGPDSVKESIEAKVEAFLDQQDGDSGSVPLLTAAAPPAPQQSATESKN